MKDLTDVLDLALFDLEGPPADHRTLRDSYREPPLRESITRVEELSAAVKQAVARRDAMHYERDK